MKEIYGLKEWGISFFVCLNHFFFLSFFFVVIKFFISFFVFSLGIKFFNYYISTTSFIMHFLCISFFLFTYYVYVCTWFSFFLDWCTFFTFTHCSCSFTFLFQHFYFFSQVIKVLSIVNLVVPPFQKVCGNYNIMYVIISPTCNVHCNACCSKSAIQKSGFLCGSIITNDEPMLLTIEGKWLKAIVHMTESKSWICLVQNKFKSSFQFTFMINFNCRAHLPLLVFKKTSNNLSHKGKPIWSAKV